MAFFVFSVMSEFSLDDPGFTLPIPPVPPSSSDSSVETPVDGRRKCSSCPRRMSKKSADRHTVCISCHGFDCDLNSRCEECLEWSEDDIIAYAKYLKSLKSLESSSSKQKSKIPLPPLTPSRPSPQPAPQPAPLPAQQPAPRPAQPALRPSQRDDLQSQMDSLASNFTSLSNNLTSQLTDFMAQFLCQNQLSRQPRLGPDAGESRPDQTAGESRMFQGEGAPSRTPLVPPYAQYPLHSDFAAPWPEQSGRARSRSPPFDAPRASTRHAPRQPPVFEAPPQPSTSGWVPPGPPPPRSRHDSSGSDSGASGSESVTSASDSASARLTDLIYRVCPASRPLFDPKAPRCEFEGWFGQPEASTSSQRFRLYPRVAEVQEEVAARSESLARRSKPLSRILPARARSYSLADDTIFAASQPVNSAFAQLTGSKTLATRRWGSVSFNDMERLERLFLNQLEVTSSSLWLMSGILAMLKQDRFQPSDPALFNSALSSVSAALSRQARSSAAGTGFILAKRRENLLAHATLPVPESQKHSLMTSPGTSSGLFDSGLLAEVVAQVHSSSQISSNLALSRSLRRGRPSQTPSSSPLTGPRLPSSSLGRPYGKRSASSSCSGSRKRFRGGKGGGAPSSGPSGFRRWESSPFRTLSGGCLSLHWQAWRDRSAEPWVVEVLREGYCLPFLRTPPLSNVPIPLPPYSPSSIKGAALEEVTLGLIAKGAVELVPLPSPGFYSRLFVVWKTSGSWRPVIDLSHLNRFVDMSHFQMETIQSVLLSVRQGDWMASIDLKEAYLQVPVHPASRRFLRFVFRGSVYQFKALCFGLSTAPQVFSRVMAPVSAILHSLGIRMR